METNIDLLGKLLASENITITRGKYRTASFNIETRVLQLPIFVGLNNVEELMMMFHEVGHALFTTMSLSNKVITAAVDKKGFKNYVNVVEDIRIERKIKHIYPGCRRDFLVGYKSLNDRDFFGVKGKNLDSLSLIDRINVFYKIGMLCGAKFNNEEMVFVRDAETVDTEDEVIELSLRIYEYAKLHKPELKPEEHPEEDNSTDSDQSEDQEEDNSTNSDQSEDQDVTGVETQNSFNTKLDLTISGDHDVFVTTRLSSPYALVNFKQYMELSNFVPIISKQLSSSIKRSAAYMFREFNMRKAATRYSKTQEATSGTLNMKMIPQYKTSIDLFKKYNITPDDQNHGIVVLLDFSGSMQRRMHSAVCEIYTLIMFCNMAKIPFKVYIFSHGLLSNVGKIFNLKESNISNTFSGLRMSLVEVATSDVKFCENEKSIANMLIGNFHGYIMSQTPLTEALILLSDILPKFKRNYHVQKVSLITITDGSGGRIRFIGENNHGIFEYKSKVFVNETVTHKTIPINSHISHSVMMEILKMRFPWLTTIGYFITNQFSIKSLNEFIDVYHYGEYGCRNNTNENRENREKIRTLRNSMKNNMIKSYAPGYDTMMIFLSNYIQTEFSIENVNATSSSRELAKALSTGMSQGIKNKVVLSNCINYLS